MLTFENTTIYGWDPAIRGMRNPLNSWKMSDSECGIVGPVDLDLMKRLIKAGSADRKFMRMIQVWVDITAPMYWWAEADTYKVGTVRNSCSKMHRMMSKPFSIDDFSHEHITDTYHHTLQAIVETLNLIRTQWKEEKNPIHKKLLWYSVLQLLPNSYNQRSTLCLNYEVLRNMYHQRKHHKLDEWRIDFCDWVKTLPYSELITDEWLDNPEEDDGK